MHWMFRDQDPRMRLTPRAAAGPFWGRGGCSACCHAWHPCVGGLSPVSVWLRLKSCHLNWKLFDLHF